MMMGVYNEFDCRVWPLKRGYFKNHTLGYIYSVIVA